MYYYTKISIVALFSAFIFVFAYELWNSQFRLANIQIDEANTPSISRQAAPDLLKFIVNQPFTYLDRGKQSFVFASQDQRYVLKFFDASQLSPSIFSFQSKSSRQRKHRQLLEGYRLAFAHIPLEGGLIYVQLQTKVLEALPVMVTDRFGINHSIDLSQIPFVIQLKAVPTRQILTFLLNENNVAAAQHCLRQLIDLYEKEYRQGIYDKDRNFLYNTGFYENRPLRLDLGRLCKDGKMENPHFFKKNLEKVFVERTKRWLEKYFPQYYNQIMESIYARLDEISMDTPP